MLLDRYETKLIQSGLKMVMYVAVRKLFKCDVYFMHSLDKGLYCKIQSKNSLNNDDINNLKNMMDDLIGKDLKIIKKVITVKDAYNFYIKINEIEKANNILYSNDKTVTIYELCGYYNYFLSDMPESTGSLKNYILNYLGDNSVVLSTPYLSDFSLPTFTNQDMILKSFSDYKNWCNLVHVNYISDLNMLVSESKIKEFIKKNDIMMDNQIYELANLIRKENKKLVLLGGPSSSGKTTSTKKLALYMSAIGLNPIYLGLDDYFKEKVDSPKLKNGEYDFESIDCIDLDLFNKQLNQILNGEEVSVPTYNFVEGKKEYKGRLIKLKENDIILIEGLHCLNEALTSTIPKDDKLKVYISPFMPLSVDRHNHISTVDIRLLRRIVRDNRTRGYNVQDTLKSWDKVRNGEIKYVFPFTNQANVILNTAYTYEMGLLRVYAEPLLYSVPIDSKYYNESRRLIDELQMFFPIPSEYISDSNILREFVGESYFERG
ncbi:MAG: hypothetical protein J6K23_01030 [Bacilli bacterium]|nr:hypothetical protein [Bacilli bacterium]